MRTLSLNELENIEGGGWLNNAFSFVAGACAGLGAGVLLKLATVPTGYGNAVAGVCAVAFVGAWATS